MKRIYQVRYEYKVKGIGPWMDGRTNVLANGDARKAINKAEKLCLKDQDVTGFRLSQVTIEAETD